MPFAQSQQGNGESLRMMSYNIRNGRGLDNKTDYERIANVIKTARPDVAAMQEVDRETQRNGRVDVMKRLAELAGMHMVYAQAIDYQGGGYGIGMLCKEKPLGHKQIALPGREEKRTMLAVEFKNYVACCTHLSLTKEDRLASVDLINDLVSQYGKPVILAGDFNAKPDSEFIKKLSSDWVMLSSPKDKTFPADKPRQTIDYIFGYKKNGSQYKISKYEVMDEPVASDHCPIYADLKIAAKR